MTLEFEAALTINGFRYDAAFDAGEEIVVLFGHSGAGKSLTLRMIAGLLRPDSGRIAVSGKTVFDSGRHVSLPPQDRGIGYVVQDLALFPHLSVAANIAFGVPPGANKRDRVRRLVRDLGLEGLEGRRPAELSGGQQQRVALARALARGSRVLLLDEPFSALDESLRSSLRNELLRLRSEFGLSVIFVTHDLREAHLLADRLAVFDDGRLLQFDARETVFRHPVSRRVARLTGVANIMRGTVVEITTTGCIVDVNGARLACVPRRSRMPAPGDAIDLCIRSERINLRRTGIAEAGLNHIRGRVHQEFGYGATHTLRFEAIGPGPPVEVDIAARPYEVLGVGQQKEWTLELPPEDIHVMQADSPGASP